MLDTEAKVIELWEGIRETPEDAPLVDLLNQLRAYGEKYGIGIAAVVEMPSQKFVSITPPAHKRVWSVGALEYLKKDIIRGL